MRSGQREPGACVIECRSSPGRCVVALLAGLREVRHHVIGIRSALVILKVAGDTRVTSDLVVVVEVAVAALPRRDHM